MSQTKESLEKQREAWKKHIAEFRASGLTTREWSDKYNIKITKFRYWIRKYKEVDLSEYEPKSKSDWVALEVVDSSESKPEAENSSMEVKIGPASIPVKPGFDKKLLSDLVKTLSELC